MTERTLSIQAIEFGTVIDHIEAGQGAAILKLLAPYIEDMPVTVGYNMPSKNGGLKDLVKLEGVVLSEDVADCISLLSPGVTLNIIQDYDVSQKRDLGLPEQIAGAFDCLNSNCISHPEPVISRFFVNQDGVDIKLRCHYCEKSFSRSLVAL